MNFFVNTLRREIERFSRHKILSLITVVIPIAISLLYLVMFSQKVVSGLPIAICDRDMSSTSRQLVNMFKSQPSLYVRLETNSVTAAEEAFNRKLVASVVYIPEGLEKDIMNLSGASVRAVVDGVFLSRASIALKAVTTILTAYNIGVETTLLSSRGMSKEQAYQFAYPIQMDQHILFNPYNSYAYFLLPALFPMLLLLTVLFSTVYVIGSEFRYGTAKQWLDTAGGNISVAIWGKMLIYLFIFLVEFVFYNTIIYRYFGLETDLRSLVLVTIGGILLILTYSFVAIALVAIFQSMRLALSLATVYGVAAFSFSGLAFPSVAMPVSIQIIGFLFPFFYYMQLFIELVMRHNPDISLALADIAMFLAFISVMLLTVPLLRKNCLNPQTYGKL